MNSNAVYVRKGTTVIEVPETDYWTCGCTHRLGDGSIMLFRHSNSVNECPSCKSKKPETPDVQPNGNQTK